MELSTQQLERIPIFPLPEVQLFPDAVLPLHVFEPRYVELVEHAVEEGGNLFAVATLQPGYEREYEGSPDVYPVMGLGVIIAAEQQENGRWNVLVRGLSRVKMVEEYDAERRFREVRVEQLEDRAVDEDHPLDDRLRSLLTQLADQAPGASEAIHLILSQAEDGGELTNLLGAHACADPILRRELFECLDVQRRLELSCKHVGNLLLEVMEAPAGGRDTLH